MFVFALFLCLSHSERSFGCPQGPPTFPSLPPGALSDALEAVQKLVSNPIYSKNISVGVVVDQTLIANFGTVSGGRILLLSFVYSCIIIIITIIIIIILFVIINCLKIIIFVFAVQLVPLFVSAVFQR
jgi:hypothetical protein